VAEWLSASGLRDVDRDALTALQRPVTDKIKDAAKGKAWKINVYADDGQRFNRVKIDLDRDEQDDETWTIFADGHIERKVSSQDNGTFDGASRLETSGWVDMTAAPPTTATATAFRPCSAHARNPAWKPLLYTGANPPPGVRKLVVCPWYSRAASHCTAPA